MSRTSVSVNSRAKALSSRSTTVVSSKSTIPTPDSDFMTLLKSNSAIKTDASNEFNIDLLPDFLPAQAYIMSMLSRYEPSLNKIGHAKLSTATANYYCSVILFGYFLAHDMYVRTPPSEFAQSWLNDQRTTDFIDFVLDLPVPEFMIPILAEYSASESEHRKNIHVIPSFAGFDYDLHFGTFIPPAFFLNIHNTLSDQTATSKPEILLDLFSRPIYTIANISKTGTIAYEATCLDFLGGNYSTTGSGTALRNIVNVPDSRLYQFFDSIFNPVLFRSYQRREHLAFIPFTTPIFATRKAVHPYNLLFSPTTTNLSEQKHVLTTVASLFKDIVPFDKTLTQIISGQSGMKIFAHGYCEYSLPLCSHDLTPVPGSLHKIERMDASTQATNFRFLVLPTKPSTTTKVKYPSVAGKTATDTKANDYYIKDVVSNLMRLTIGTSATDYPADSDFVTFDENRHLFPPTLVFDPTGQAEIDGYKVTLAGKVIMSIDIDGSSIGMPNPHTPLGVENSLFFDSCLPYSILHPRTSFFKSSTFTGSAIALKRARTFRQTMHPASTFLVDRTTLLIPQYEEETYDALSSGSYFPGYTNQDSVSWIKFALRYIGFHSPDNNANAPTEIPGMPTSRTIVAWSPYSYTAAVDQDSIDSIPDFSKSRKFMIMNMRTIFGTDIPLVKIKSIFEAMPNPST